MSPDEISWHKSSYSGGNGGDCVEAACTATGEAALRDSKNPAQPHLSFSVREWRAFLADLRDGQL